MARLNSKCVALLREMARAIDFPERPQREREGDPGGNAGVLTEAERHRAVPLAIIQRECLFKVHSGVGVVTPKPAGQAEQAVGDPDLNGIRLALCIAEKRLANSCMGPSSARKPLPAHMP